MKNLALFLASILSASVWLDACAQSYTIDWFSIGGGGGTVSAGPYSLSSTIGQPDASATMTGDAYSIVGGFWSPVGVVQTPGGPALKISLTATNTAVIFWAWPSTGWVVQQNAALGTTNWTVPSETITHDAVNNLLVVNSSAGHRVFRLSNRP